VALLCSSSFPFLFQIDKGSIPIPFETTKMDLLASSIRLLSHISQESNAPLSSGRSTIGSSRGGAAQFHRGLLAGRVE
jgi:hypothetical protein